MFARHPIFMFVVYDIIHRRKVVLEYSLLVKLGIWKKTMELIHKITYNQLISMTIKIKETN